MYYDMDSLDWRALVLGLFNGTYSEEEAMNIIEAKKCCTCGCYDLEEYMHENEDGVYCDTCWQSR
jgi:hypothetical protein